MLAVLALATQALVWVFCAARGRATPSSARHVRTTRLTNFTLDSLDEQGQHSFTMIAPRLARKEDDGSIYVTTPNYEIVDNSGNMWKGTSESAWVNKDGTIMKLRRQGRHASHRRPKRSRRCNC